jgi:hypothetical protein
VIDEWSDQRLEVTAEIELLSSKDEPGRLRLAPAPGRLAPRLLPNLGYGQASVPG